MKLGTGIVVDGRPGKLDETSGSRVRHPNRRDPDQHQRARKEPQAEPPPQRERGQRAGRRWQARRAARSLRRSARTQAPGSARRRGGHHAWREPQ
jgi:hypothetical protein